MSYQVTARKWRPMVFEDVVGQSHVTETLRNAISTNRLAHAYIFSGARGCGKTTTARILAKAINCLSPKDINPDNECEVCKEITAGRSLDVIEIDGASNRGVEEIRNLRESVRYTPARGKYKVYIIDEVHMLTKEAFNALLKTLEEPPEHVIFIFATTEVHKIPMTILSRCQRFDFRRIAIEEITSRLRFIAGEEGVIVDEGALMIIAKKGDGSMRDAQSIFDQIRSFCGNEIKSEDVLKVLNAVDQEVYFGVTDLIRDGNARGGIELVDRLMKNGYDLREFLGGLSEHLRNMLIVLTTDAADLIETSEPYRKRYREEAKQFHQNDILRLLKLVNDLEQAIRWAAQPRFKLEAGLLHMIKMKKTVEIDALLRQIDELKKKLGSNGLPAPGDIPKEPGRNAGPPGEKLVKEVKVVGQVSAGRISSPAAMTYSSYREMATRPAPGPFGVAALASITMKEPAPAAVPVSPEPLLGVETMAPITVEQAYEAWREWLGEVRKTKIGLWTLLSESSILDVADGALRIACPDDFHLSSLKRNKDFLIESFQGLTGQKVRIEPILHVLPKNTPGATVLPFQESTVASSPRAVRPSPVTEAASPPEPGANGSGNGNAHPIIAALVRELGAEKVE